MSTATQLHTLLWSADPGNRALAAANLETATRFAAENLAQLLNDALAYRRVNVDTALDPALLRRTGAALETLGGIIAELSMVGGRLDLQAIGIAPRRSAGDPETDPDDLTAREG